jgi:glycerophosphoryl diester phosphodiesterase
MSSFRKAVEMGVDGLKTEAQLSKDGEVILSFYNQVKFNGVSAKISELTVEEIKKVRLENNEQILTIREFFDEFGKKDLRFNFDIKEAPIGVKIIEVGEELNLIDKIEIGKPVTVFTSLEDFFRPLREKNEKVSFVNSVFGGYINISEKDLEFDVMEELNIDVFNIQHYKSSFELFKLIKDSGYKCYLWGVLFKHFMKKYLKMNYDEGRIDAIFTNYPDTLLQLRNEIQS